MAILKDLKPVKVNFNLRQTKETTLLTGVNCVVRWNNQRLVLTSVERIKPTEWNDKGQKANSKFIGNAEFNHRLKNIKGNIENAFRSYLNDFNRYPSLEEFRVIAKKAINSDAVEFAPAVTRDVVKYIEQYISDCETGVKTASNGHPMSFNSIKKFKALRNNLDEFIQFKKIKELTFEKLSIQLLEDFKRFLISEKEYTPGTISTRLMAWTTVLNWATKLKINANLDYKDAGLSKAPPQTFEIYLNLDELTAIQNLDLTGKPRLDRVRDLFLLGAWTSLRFSDLFQVSHKLIEEDREGNRNIRITPHKTKRELIIPILPVTQQILDKYTLPDGSIELPEISNQKFNQNIKDLGKEAEINEVITFTMIKAGKKEVVQLPKYELIRSHTMRRSFATNLYEMGEDIKAIMDATGHTRMEMFFRYIRRTQNNSAKKIRQTIESQMRQRMKAVS